MATAVFPGSFDPFTIGHADILERALRIFDRVVIGVGFNISKPERAESARSRASDIAALYRGRPEITVEAYSGLTVDFARCHDATCIVRGVRECADFEYERRLADINAEISEIDTLLLPARPALAAVSSSAVRELALHGYDVSRFLPNP